VEQLGRCTGNKTLSSSFFIFIRYAQDVNSTNLYHLFLNYLSHFSSSHSDYTPRDHSIQLVTGIVRPHSCLVMMNLVWFKMSSQYYDNSFNLLLNSTKIILQMTQLTAKRVQNNAKILL